MRDHWDSLLLEMPVAVLAAPNRVISTVEKLVYCATCGHGSGYTISGHMAKRPPTIEEISAAIGLPVDATSKALASLVNKGLILDGYPVIPDRIGDFVFDEKFMRSDSVRISGLGRRK